MRDPWHKSLPPFNQNYQFCWAGHSWVKTLSLLIEGLKLNKPHASEIILPTYACNEFVKAILLANCQPKFIDCDVLGNLSLEALQTAVKVDTLAVLVVNNTGMCSSLEGVVDFCKQQKLACIEDAGYTIGGRTADQRWLGSLADHVIINTSEGKWFCMGGGIILTRQSQGVIDFLEGQTSKCQETSPLGDFMALMVYKLGSSELGFRMYQILKRWGFGDLKQRFSREPSRIHEHYAQGDIDWDGKQWCLHSNHEKVLKSLQLKSWGAFRWAWFAAQWQALGKFQAKRYERYKQYQSTLGSEQIFPFNEYHNIVKVPFLLSDQTPDEMKNTLYNLGVTKQYPASWKMAKMSFGQGKRLYNQCYTLPIHEGVGRGTQNTIIALVKPYTMSWSQASNDDSSED